MVRRKLFQNTATITIQATVSNIHHIDALFITEHAYKSGSHSLVLRKFNALVCYQSMSFIHPILYLAGQYLMGKIGRKIGNKTVECLGSQLTGKFSTFVSAHTIRYKSRKSSLRNEFKLLFVCFVTIKSSIEKYHVFIIGTYAPHITGKLTFQ